MSGKTAFSITKLALCQVQTEQWHVEGNLERTLRALDAAGTLGAQIAVTPECVLHGYGEGGAPDYARRMLEVAEPLDGPHFGAVREKAAEHEMDVVFGFAERGEGENVHNSAAFISRDGDVAAVYRKVHCRPFESTEHQGRFVPGERFEMVERDYAKIGLMICFDREIPESVRCLRALGSELVACPLATGTTDLTRHLNRAHNEMITRARAAENEVFIAVINHAGRFNGGSFVVGPMGEMLCQMASAAGVKVVDVPVGVVREKFHANPLGWMGWGHRREHVYRKHIGS